MTAAREALTQLCKDLRRLRDQAGGPSVRSLAVEVGLGKSQVDTILNGRVRRPPDWRVVRGLVEAFYRYAEDRGREPYLSIRAGLDEYWRPRHAMVEQAFESFDARRAAPAGVVPRQLPPVAPHFVGRTAELAAMVRSPGAPVLVTGMAGVGKTALAVACAHRVAHQYPDGQLYLNLRGFDPSRPAMTAAEAVRGLLEGLGVSGAAFPHGVGEQIGLYRSLLADRRVLIVLDDARDAGQVRDLLPGTPTCRVLVTSRLELTELIAVDGAYPVALDGLPGREARRMLALRLGEERVGAEPEAVERIIEACGRLPIALAIVSARAATRPDFPLSAIADEAGPVLRGLPAVFSWSYRMLTPAAARLFRLLGLHAGPDAGPAAVASLAAVTDAEAAELLAQLTRAHLVTEPAVGRYGLHDLLRAYALDLAAAEPEAEAARRRYIDHYLHTAYRATRLVSPHRWVMPLDPVEPGVRPETFADRDEALAWFAAERPVLLAATETAESAGHDARAWQLAWAVADFLELRGHADDWIAVQGHAVAAGRRHAPPEVLARSLCGLGAAYALAERYDDAWPCYEEAAKLCHDAGDLVWQARAVTALGVLLDRQGRFRESLDLSRQALDLFRAAGDAKGEARAHNSIGWSLANLGEYARAIEHCKRALTHYRGSGNRVGQAACWDSIGLARHGLGEYGQAVLCFERAIDLLRAHGDRFNEAGTLDRLGLSHAAAGDPEAARDAWWRALVIYDELGHPGAAAIRERISA